MRAHRDRRLCGVRCSIVRSSRESGPSNGSDVVAATRWTPGTRCSRSDSASKKATVRACSPYRRAGSVDARDHELRRLEARATR